MLTFLRKIRKALIESGPAAAKAMAGKSARKYLLYAIGEIALVVIGILIALQINNWNTNNKEEKELHTYLENIRSNMKDDLESLKEMRTFRDSSISYSAGWIRMAKKERITPEELMNQEYTGYGVFIDKYFQPRSSGFEALKSSGFIGMLNGTELEKKLNKYYYTVDKIRESETSLNNTIETMENLAFDKNVRQRIIEIIEAYRNNQKLPTNIHAEIKELVNQPNLYAANLRNMVDSTVSGYYRQAEELARSIIAEIETSLEE